LAEGEQPSDEFLDQQESSGIDTTAPITDEQGVEAATLLEEIIAKMGIAGTAAFVRSEDGSARINVSSEDSAILIGRKGRNLSAMQYLINRMISRGDTNENTERIVVDVEGYVDRRRESLEELARTMATRAKETQRNMRLKPLSPQERRIIHLTLQGDEEIRTFSLGESLFRSVVISPKNAVRPERAPRSSRGNRGGRRRGGRGRSGGGEFAGRSEGGDIDVGALSD
jgi:spoIIIJ-associated protein